jgi:hypothetical protein
VDTSKLSQGQMVAGVGGVLLIISLFLHWAGAESAWNGFTVVHILILLVGIAAIAWAVLPLTGAAVSLPPGAPGVVAALGLIVFGFAAGWELEISGDVGVWLAVLASLGIFYGANMGSRRATAAGVSRAAPAAPPAPPPPGAPAV